MQKIIAFFFILCFSAITNAQIITTVAGLPSGSVADNVAATAANIGFPGYMVFDDSGNYYITNNRYEIRRISNLGVINTIAGNGTSGYAGDGTEATNAEITLPGGIALDHLGNIYIPDISNHRIRKVEKTTGIITTIAGTGTPGFSGDGFPATAAELNEPWAIAFDHFGNLYFADDSNYRIREIDTAGIITTIAGIGTSGSLGDGGLATAAELASMESVRTDIFDNLYIAETERIRKINLRTVIINCVAGTDSVGYSGDGGPATAATLHAAVDVLPDKNGNFFISEEYNHTIRKVDTAGIINTIAGNHIPGYTGDGGLATAAEINYPRGIALDACGNLYILDAQNGRIRKVTYEMSCNILDSASLKTSTINATNNGLKIYPNPAHDELNVAAANNITGITITNLLGQQIRSLQYNSATVRVDIQGLPAGVYFMKVTDEDGVQTVERVIKSEP